eukprot:1454186-Pleurochrysis_carterae.AAC.3
MSVRSTPPEQQRIESRLSVMLRIVRPALLMRVKGIVRGGRLLRVVALSGCDFEPACQRIQARWLTEQKYNELKKPTWAKDLIRWGESQGLHWVNRPDKERELHEAEKLRNEEMARVVHRTQEQKSRLEEQLRKREAELEQK